MPEVIQSSEGHALMEYKIVLGEKRTLAFDPTRITFVDAEIRDDVYDVSMTLNTFRTIDPTFLDALKHAMSTADPVLEFRLGFGSPTNLFWLPWQRHLLVNYFARYEGIGTAAGHLLVLKTASDFTRYERSNKVVARKGTVAEIVRAIADENKLEAVIEPTDGKFLLYQSFLDDVRFIRHHLLKRAISQSGRGGFYFYIRDNVLHFHTPDYQSNVRQMNYYDVLSTGLDLNDLSQDSGLWDSGVAGIRVIGYDPYTGQTREVSSLPDKALRLSDHLYQFANVNNGAWNIPYHLSTNPPVEVAAIAQFNYQRARQQIFRCEVSLAKTIALRHGDLLNINITQETSSASSHSGYYYVTGVLHIVKKQSVSSVYTLERGEFLGSVQSLSTQDAQGELLPESKAPGQFPNILEIQSSEATKGAGKRSSAKTFTGVMDANTGKLI